MPTLTLARAKELLNSHIDKLHFVARYLLDHEDMDGDLFKAAMDAETPTNEMLDAIVAERERQSKEANEARARAEAAAKARAEAMGEADGDSDADSDKDRENDGNGDDSRFTV